MIEAKRVDRTISSGQISKYIDRDTRGIVTNGIDWICCYRNRTASISTISQDSTKISKDAVEMLVKFITTGTINENLWVDGPTEIKARISPIRPQKEHLATRVISKTSVLHSAKEAINLVIENEKTSKLERLLIMSLLKNLGANSEENFRFRFDVRDGRLSIFDTNFDARSMRICRIAIGKQKPDVIFSSNLSEKAAALDLIAVPHEHDKGSHMKCYRLGSEEQTVEFGRALGILLTEI